jgi:cytochrome c-type biogenesis protein CcmE
VKYTPAQQPESLSSDEPRGGLNRRMRLIIVGFVIAVAFGYFGFTAFQSATSYYLTVDELIERGPSAGDLLQVKGSLVLESFTREAADGSGPTIVAEFLLEDNGHQVSATFDGALPDLFFNPHSEIVLGGTYGEDGVFAADRVLVKCPSKYRALEVELPPGYGEQT